MLTEKVAKGQYTFLSPWWDEIDSSAQDLISHLLTVDPEKRYTIKEFLAHPWVRAAGQTPTAEAAKPAPEAVAALKAKVGEGGDKKYDFRSPAAVNLREVFDVSYAVHRQEEESKRRRQLGLKGAPGGGAADALGQVPEDEEGEDEDEKMGGDDLEARMRDAKIDEDDKRGRERERAPAPGEKGYGQHSAAVASAARQQVKSQQRQKGVFELSLDGATLLGRRGMKPATKVGGA